MQDTMESDGALFERLRPRLTAISRRILGSAAEAEDVVQDCFLKWHGAQRSALETPAAWLTTVVRHQSIDRLRRRARDEAAVLAASDLASSLAPDGACAAPPELALLRRADMEAALVRMIGALSPAERLALVLHEVFDCDHADVAAVLGTKAVNARQHLARARRRLRAAQDGTRDGTPAATRTLEEKLCRELVRRFQAALAGADVAAMVSLLAPEQPLSVLNPAPRGVMQRRSGSRGCANDAAYALAA